jgi:hypothetical protein
MKSQLPFFGFLLFANQLFAQNAGIGVVTPQYKLDVLNLVRIHPSGNINPGFLLEGTTNINRAFVGMFSFNQAGIYGYNGAGYALVTNINGNNGIGVENPSYSLDVNGRVRFRNKSGQSAGLYLENSSAQGRAFIGAYNDNHVGMYGSLGASWNIAMNIQNGNVGIGTSAPTAQLHVAGNMRIRAGNPTAGSVLISTDANGNTEWQQPVSFRVEDLLFGTLAATPGTWKKLIYANPPVFNAGNAYDTDQDIFTAPYNGLYEFQVSQRVREDMIANRVFLRIMLQRNGVSSELLRHDYEQSYSSALDEQTQARYKVQRGVYFNFNTGAFQLFANDKIWVELYNEGPYQFGTMNWFAAESLALERYEGCLFSGQLISKN